MLTLSQLMSSPAVAPSADSKLIADQRADQPLPRYGMVYLNHLSAEYFFFRTEGLNKSGFQQLEEILRRKANNEPLTWHDLYLFELVLAKALPIDRLRNRISALRVRYRNVVGCVPYEEYVAGSPPDPRTATDDELHADAEYLISEIHFRYSITHLRERERARVTHYVYTLLTLFLLGIAVICIAAAFQEVTPTWSSVAGAFLGPKMLPVAVMLAGALGGLVSMQQRYSKTEVDGDPMLSVSLLGSVSRASVIQPSVAGAAFGLMLMFVFSGGLIGGDFVPQFVDEAKASATGLQSFFDLMIRLPHGSEDYPKLLVWSFVAGFAERFVPDTLTKLVVRKEAKA